MALFGVVTTLRVAYPEINLEMCRHMATDLASCMKENLARAWPSLQEIKFFCTERRHLRMTRKSDWRVVKCTSKRAEFEHSHGQWF